MRLLLAVLAVFVSGCFLPKAMSTPLAGDADKVALLAHSVDRFHRALGWGDAGMASEYVATEALATYQRKMLEGVGQLVSVKAGAVEFPPHDSNLAYVDAYVNYFDESTRLVSTKKRREQWEFRRFAGGWKFCDILFSENAKTDDPLGIRRSPR